ncbi:hypothetical protein [Halosegnis sp.]|uniref:DUF7125 family protein n=1 Tax=Halosegnis sp. TaxID=2864959 RepID=UPI0035D3FC1E
MNAPRRRYSTGLQFLDRRVDGGLAAGTMLALVAPAHSQSALILRQLLCSRQTLHVSTLRPEKEVRAWATDGAATPPELAVFHASPEELCSEFERVESAIPPESFVMFDRVNGLEAADREAYLEVLDRLKTKLEEMDSVGILHCTDTYPSPEKRGVTLSRADQVWQLELLPLSRDIKNRLLVTKSRYGRALREPIDVLLTDRVEVDTSRRIS